MRAFGFRGRVVCTTGLLAALAVVWIGPANAEEAPEACVEASGPVFQAGATTVDVTPPIGLPMWGYASRRDNPNQGIMDPLEANIAVVSDGETTIALVGLDLGRAPTRHVTQSIRERAQKDGGVDSIFLVGSHTHHGPVLELDNIPSDKPYVKELEEKLVAGIVTAAKKMQPAKIGVGKVETTLNRNRHSKLPNKPVDRDLIVIRLVDMKDQTIATLVNFAAHPTMIRDLVYEYSADYPGHMKRRVEQELGGVCIFLQGAEGDLSPNGDGLGHTGFGRKLGEEVIQLAKTIQPTVPKQPRVQVRDEELQFTNMRIDFSNNLLRAIYSRVFFKELIDFFMEEYKDGVRPHLTVAILNNEIGLVGGSGEFFCSHSIRLKERSRLPYTLFLGCCNDYQQYFPTIEAAAEGGYGADPTVSPVEIGAGEIIMNRGLFHLYDMQNKFKKTVF